MAEAVQFYRSLGFEIRYGGQKSAFTSFTFGSNYLNLVAQSAERRSSWWGRVIFYVDDVDAFYAHAIGEGLKIDSVPRDARWGERYFHVTDPDGHELSFATPLDQSKTL